MKLTKEQHNEFLRLSSALSPENLYCDGEISRSAAQRKERALLKEWKALEKKIGHEVSEDEVWKRHLDEMRARRAS